MSKNMNALLISFFILSACSIWTQPYPETRAPNQAQDSTSSKIKISFIGDILVHRVLYESVMLGSDRKFSKLWIQAIPFFKSADYSYANLEGPVALGIDGNVHDNGDIGFVYDGKVYSGTGFSFNYHPNIIDDIKASGIDIVSTANNHTKDRGMLGIDKTVDAMNAKGMTFIGTRKKADKAFGPLANMTRITPIKDFKVGWVSCTEELNGRQDEGDQVLFCYSEATQITTLIQDLKKNKGADIVIVTPHWGVEYSLEPTKDQKKFARLFLDAGADVVMGSHPHVLQPVEQYKTKDGRDTFIAYSLGNFVSGQGGLEKKASAIVFLEFEKNQGRSRISNYTYQPTSFTPAADPNAFPHMILATGMSDTLKHIESLISRKRIPLAK